jgi:anaerobic ribonucleoside-triphosphate reductase activating protein
VIQVYGTVDDSIVDGPGMRLAIFAQGCARHCPGCHNPQAQPYEGGSPATTEELMEKVRANPLLTGVTLTGGEPFDQAAALVELAGQVRAAGLSVWAYSGYSFEELAGLAADAAGLLGLAAELPAATAGQVPAAAAGPTEATAGLTAAAAAAAGQVPSPAAGELLRNIDVLVDGPYLEAQRDLDLQWRGSANQRLVDVPASLAAGEVICIA